MKTVIIFIIKTYQKVFSPDKSLFFIFRKKTPTCAFYPTCSDYAIEAISKHGARKGTMLSIKRILRCHPWQKKHFDPVP